MCRDWLVFIHGVRLAELPFLAVPYAVVMAFDVFFCVLEVDFYSFPDFGVLVDLVHTVRYLMSIYSAETLKPLSVFSTSKPKRSL